MSNSLTLKRYSTRSEFLKEIKPFLSDRELENTALVVFAMQEAQDKQPEESSIYCGTLWNEHNHLVFALSNLDKTTLYATWTDNQEAVERLTQDFLASGAQPGVEWIQAFEPVTGYINTSLANSGIQYKVDNTMWAHRATSVTLSPRLRAIIDEGRTQLKQATLEDLSLLIRWTQAYFDDIAKAERIVDLSIFPPAESECLKAIKANSVYMLWLDNEPVSMAWSKRPTWNGCAIAHVFTPSERRGQGNGALCVGLLTEKLLQEFKYVTLFVMRHQDPHRNLYTSVGYEFCAEAARLRAVVE